MTPDPAPILAALEAAWARSDALFDRLAPGALLDRPIPLRHPFVFYLGHLPAFGVNQVVRGVLGEPGVNDSLEDLFERGIDPDSAEEAAEAGVAAWPPRAEIEAFRDAARERLRASVGAVLDRADADPLAEGLRIYHLVVEHELMHHETLLYMLAELAPERKVAPADAPPPVLGSGPEPEAVAIPAGPVTVGASYHAVPFGWDNEFPAETIHVERLALDRYPVTVEQLRGFVESGGYAEREWWSEEAWAWLQETGRAAPWRWRRAPDDRWWHRTLYGQVRLDDVGGWPALVTAAEAEAFCAWSGARLPTEAEWLRAAYGRDDADPGGPWPWGAEPPDARHGNLGDRFDDPVPVHHHPAGDSAFGASDLLGNGWEWTATAFAPRPGFTPWARTYPGYSADFFDGQHRVLLGGSWPTDPRLLRRSFRNWFRPTYPWVFATFRRAW